MLWFSDHAPPSTQTNLIDPTQDSDPLFVTQEMLNELLQKVAGYVEVTASLEALEAGTEGMVFRELEALAARRLMGPRAHGEAVGPLSKALQPFL